MSLLNIIHAKSSIKKNNVLIALVLMITSFAAQAWEVDLSRRKELRQKQDLLAEGAQGKEPTFLDAIFQPGDPIQELVILNTETGFIPSTVRVRAGMRYNVFVVNINEKEKNVSFVLDAFSEHHSTYFGKVRRFQIEPKKEGIFSFQCPETSTEGRLVVYPVMNKPPGVSEPQMRTPASQ